MVRSLAPLAIFIVLGLLVFGLGFIPTASADFPPVCTDYEQEETFVVVTPDGDRTWGPGETVGVYPESELTQWVCPPTVVPDQQFVTPVADSVIDLTDVEEIASIREIEPGTAEVIQVGEVGTVDTGTMVTGDPVPGPTIMNPDTVIETEFVGAGVMPVVDSADRDRYQEAEAAFHAATDNISAINNDLPDQHEELAGGTDNPEAVSGPATAIDESVNDLNSATTALEISIAAIGSSHTGSAAPGQALKNVHDQRETVAHETTEALRAYDNALTTALDEESQTVRLLVGGPAILGLLIGGAIGFIGPTLMGRRVRTRLDSGEWVRYSQYNLLIPVGFGLVVFLTGIGLFWYSFGTEVLWVIV